MGWLSNRLPTAVVVWLINEVPPVGSCRGVARNRPSRYATRAWRRRSQMTRRAGRCSSHSAAESWLRSRTARARGIVRLCGGRQTPIRSRTSPMMTSTGSSAWRHPIAWIAPFMPPWRRRSSTARGAMAPDRTLPAEEDLSPRGQAPAAPARPAPAAHHPRDARPQCGTGKPGRGDHWADSHEPHPSLCYGLRPPRRTGKSGAPAAPVHR
jgi:hypothetical protein